MGSAQGLIASTPYETWARTMQAWAADPTIPLDHLPELADDTFTPQTYERLLVYIRSALEAVTERWATELGRALSSWRTPYELAHSLVQLRSSLARRVQLSRHPSLPPTVRDVLSRDAERSIQRYQVEIEESIRDSLARSSLSKTDREHVLRIIHENAFTRALEVAVVQTGERQTVAALPEVSSPTGPPPSRYGHRRVLPSS